MYKNVIYRWLGHRIKLKGFQINMHLMKNVNYHRNVKSLNVNVSVYVGLNVSCHRVVNSYC